MTVREQLFVMGMIATASETYGHLRATLAAMGGLMAITREKL